MPTANEVFQAAKRGQIVKHKYFGQVSFDGDGYLIWLNSQITVKWAETELDETAWTIEPKYPDIFAGLDERIAELKKSIDELEYIQRATLAANGENVK